MQQIIYYLRTFSREPFRLSYVLTLAVLLAAAIWYNYHIDFENSFLDSFTYQPLHIPYTFAFYCVPYYGSVLLYALFHPHRKFLRQPGFWFTSLLGILVLTINDTFYYQNLYYDRIFEYSTAYFARKTSNQLVSELIFFAPLIVFWYINDRKTQPLYGFDAKRINLRPYLLMLAIMVPLIVWASFQDDFLRAYPSYRNEQDDSPAYWWHFLVYELFYGIDFIGVEFFFRGFLVLALARYLGPAVIFPMVCLYAFMHFGKPMGETIGSVFGGAILGIIAYYSRSIYGGIIIHMGVAYLMDLTAFVQTLLRQP